MSDPTSTGGHRLRWRSPRRWSTIVGGAAFVVVFVGGLALQDWADDHEVWWLASLFSPGVPLAALVYNLVERWRIARRLGGSDQRVLYYRALKDDFLPGDQIGDLHRWRAELDRGGGTLDSGWFIGAGLAGAGVAWWYLWPDDPTPSSAALPAAVLLAIVGTTVYVLIRDARPRPPQEPRRLVQAIDLRIAAEERDGHVERR